MSAARHADAADAQHTLSRAISRRAHAHSQVAVTGASGQTGSLAIERLLAKPDSYEPVAIVRSEAVGGR